MDDTKKLKLAHLALVAVCRAIQREKDVAYHLGPGSQTFDYLTASCAVLEGRPLSEIREVVCPGANAVPHETAEQILERRGQ
jgi:hypothetical protein